MGLQLTSVSNSPARAGAVVLGGYVNGYSIIRELREQGVSPIWLLDTQRSLASYSNQIDGYTLVRWTPDSLRQTLIQLSSRYGRLVLFPTNDEQLEILHAIYDDVSGFCFLPFNRKSLLSHLDKSMQYAYCERLGVAYPRSVELSLEQGIDHLNDLSFPVIIKPRRRDDATTEVFRNLLLEKETDFIFKKEELKKFMGNGIDFLASEVVPGDDAQIYAYTAYRSPCGRILSEWIGKKLTQYPDRFGVFSSASNEAPEEVRALGRKLLDGMDLYGIVEPEFKYDARDGVFKLMEVNLRSMMWNRLGNRSGVYLQFTQWQDALGLPVQEQAQERSRRIHLVYIKHEIVNLLSRWGYWKHFFQNLFGGDERHFAVFDWHDIGPAIRDLRTYPRAMVSAWLKRFGLR